MNNIKTITSKELKDYFISPIAYVVALAFTVVTSIWFVKDLFIENSAEMREVFNFIPLLLIVVIPAVTMRSWAEEKREQTLEVISTLPIKRGELIISKFLSAFLYTLFLILLTLPIPITLNVLGSPDNGVIIAGYLGLFLLSATYIVIGQFISINTNNQIVSFIISAVIILVLYVVGEPRFLEILPSGFRPYFESLGLGAHFRSIAKGVLDTRDILYYLSIIIVLFTFIYKSLKRIYKTGN